MITTKRSFGILLTAAMVSGAALLTTTATAATASAVTTGAITPQTADTVCSASVVLPGQGGSTVVLPATRSGSTDCFLVKGDVSVAVGDLQLALRLCGGQRQVTVDNNFGSQTKTAEEAVQRATGITADGGYGNQTRGVLSWPDNDSLTCRRPIHF
jgi:hypothetical protein